MSWNELFPNGRVVFYEGDDPEGFAKELAARGIDVEAQPPENLQEWLTTCNWAESRSFFIPAGRVEEIYGDSRWPLGS